MSQTVFMTTSIFMFIVMLIFMFMFMAMSMFMFVHAVTKCIIARQHGHPAWTRSIEKDSSMDMDKQDGQWIYLIDMDMDIQHRHGHAKWSYGIDSDMLDDIDMLHGLGHAT